MGFADVHPQTSSTTVSIQLHYQVASLEATLTGMPTSCESAYISVATPASTLSLSSQYNGTQSTRIPLTPVTDAVPVPDGSPSGQSSTVPSASASGHTLTTNPTATAPTALTFNPTTGLFPTASRFTRTLNVSSAVGKTFGIFISFMADAYPATADVLVEARNASGDLVATRTFTDLTFHRAKICTIQSYLFSGTTSTTLTFEEWTSEDPITIE